MIEIETPAEVIEALGGDQAVADRYDRTVQCVRNWRYARNGLKIPPVLESSIQADLKRRKKPRAAASAFTDYRPRAIRSGG